MAVPVDFRIEIAPGVDPDASVGTWNWLDITSYRRQKSDLEINFGRDDESSEVEPGDVSTTINLRDGLLSNRNANSQLFRKLRVNTPFRIRYPRTLVSTFDTNVASGWGTAESGQTWQTLSGIWSVSGGKGNASLASAGTFSRMLLPKVGSDFSMVYSLNCPVLPTGASWTNGVMIRYIDANNFYLVRTTLTPGGQVILYITRYFQGVTTDLASNVSTGVSYDTNSTIWTRIYAIAGGIRARVWTGALADEPADVWTPTAGAPTWHVTAADGNLDGIDLGFRPQRDLGNTNAGTFGVTMDNIQVDSFLYAGFVPEWSPRWDKSGKDATATFAAAGPLRKMAQGEDRVESALTGYLSTAASSNLWPFEEDSDATQAASAIAGGTPAVTRSVSFNAEAGVVDGSLTMAKIDSASTLAAMRCTVDTGSDPQGILFFRFANLPTASNPTLVEWRTLGTIARWQIRANATGFNLHAFDVTGAEVLAGTTVTYQIDPLQPFSLRLKLTQVSGDVFWELAWSQVGSGIFWGTDGTVTGQTNGRITEARVTGHADLVDNLFGMVWAGPASFQYVSTVFLLITAGYASECANNRVSRIGTQAGYKYTGVAGTYEQLGAQVPDAPLTVIKEAMEADGGRLYERGFGIAIVPRRGLTHVPVTLALDWSAGDLAEAPDPTDDDQRLRNRWTIKRKNGSEYTFESAESIAKHGRIGDSKEINIYLDSRLPGFAAWQTALSTYDALRWPVIQIDLVSNPHLLHDFLACKIGSRVTIANPKSQIPGQVIDLVIEGMKITLGRHKFLVELACSPARPWDVGIYDDSTHATKYDAATSTIASPGIDATTTSIPISTVKASERWSTSGTPYDWQLDDTDSEIVTVTSITAASGSGPYTQTATVVRGVNGVQIAHSSGEKVSLARPAHWGL